jgi:serine/threonine-protein kinase
MLLGRGPFVADETAALLYQIINLDPHPLAPRVPGLPPAVESVLRRALSKRPADRFPSMRAFSRALEAATSGRPADATLAPVAVSPAIPANATIGYGATPVPPTPAAPASPAPRDASKPDADEARTVDDSIELPRNRIRPIHAIIAAVGVLLLLGAYLLIGARRTDMRPSSAPVATPRTIPPPTPKPAPGPTVTPLPAPEPPPAAAATPEPAPVPPAPAGEAKPPVAKRPQPALAPVAKPPAAESSDVDKILREYDKSKAQAINPAFDTRAKRWRDPFPDDDYVLPEAKKPRKPVSPPASKPPPSPKPQERSLIEEL